MRRLLYIPIIHSEADMGGAGAALAQKSAAVLGQRRWERHQDTVHRYWESIRAFLLPLDPTQVKMYQDGLAADGDMGRHIVEEAARRGSQNYHLVLELLSRGAELRKTEDPALLLQERQSIAELAQPGEAGGDGQDTRRYRERRDRLMEERDRFMAETISATLKEGELGLLLVGTYHDVVPRLAPDIQVRAARDPGRVRAYFAELLQGHNDRSLAALARYLVSPVRIL